MTTRAPLAMPPSFTLPPPSPGATRPQEQSERTKAELALVPQMALGTPAEGSSAGPAGAGPGGRPAGDPGDPHRGGSGGQSSTGLRRVSATSCCSGARPPQPGIVVDPEKEAQRLRENSALGQSQETGDTPIVQPKKRAWLDGIF